MEWLSTKVVTVLKTGRRIGLERRDLAFIEPLLSSITGQGRLAVDIFCGSAQSEALANTELLTDLTR